MICGVDMLYIHLFDLLHPTVFVACVFVKTLPRTDSERVPENPGPSPEVPTQRNVRPWSPLPFYPISEAGLWPSIHHGFQGKLAVMFNFGVVPHRIHVWHSIKNQPDVGKYTIHGSYGYPKQNYPKSNLLTFHDVHPRCCGPSPGVIIIRILQSATNFTHRSTGYIQ